MTNGPAEVAQSCPVAIVGAGHWLLGHDRVGPRVLELIEGRYDPEIEIIDAGTSGLSLLDYLHGQELMLVVDACIYGGQPGEVTLLEPDLDTPTSRETSVHQIGPVETLKVARQLFPESLPRRVILVLVETAGADEEVQEAACRQVVDVLDNQIERWRTGMKDRDAKGVNAARPTGAC